MKQKIISALFLSGTMLVSNFRICRVQFRKLQRQQQ